MLQAMSEFAHTQTQRRILGQLRKVFSSVLFEALCYKQDMPKAEPSVRLYLFLISFRNSQRLVCVLESLKWPMKFSLHSHYAIIAWL